MPEQKNETMHHVILAVGSNIDPRKNIAGARTILSQEQALLGESSWMRTSPDGYQDQPDFINGAFYIKTALDPIALKSYLRQVEEKRLGRIRSSIKSGPRTIDLDIIIWNSSVVDEDYYNKSYIKNPIDEICRAFNLELEHGKS